VLDLNQRKEQPDNVSDFALLDMFQTGLFQHTNNRTRDCPNTIDECPRQAVLTDLAKEPAAMASRWKNAIQSQILMRNSDYLASKNLLESWVCIK